MIVINRNDLKNNLIIGVDLYEDAELINQNIDAFCEYIKTELKKVGVNAEIYEGDFSHGSSFDYLSCDESDYYSLRSLLDFWAWLKNNQAA